MNRNRSRIKVWKQALACLAAAALGWPQAAPAIAAAHTVEEGRPILPGEVKCPYDLPPHVKWTEQEKWAWSERICLGEVANMSQFGGGDGLSCDPEEADDWPETRDLSSAFLETILNHEPYRGALPRSGVRIRCARFNDTLDLRDMVLERPLWLDASRFRRDVVLMGLRSSSLISLRRSVFDGRLTADRLDVAGNLFIEDAYFKMEVRLLGAKVGGNLFAIGSTFEGLFNVSRLEVAGGLFMRNGAHFKKGVRLLGAKVGGQLSAIGSTFDGPFNADGLAVAGSLYMRDGASFKAVDLSGAKIGGQLQLRDSDFDGHLDLTSVSILDELQLNSPRHPPPRWSEQGRLTLRNARVGALNDTEDAWDIQPGRLDLVGFTYDRLGGLGATKDSAMSARSTDWLRDWLAKQDGFYTSYNPQPFEQLAKVLRESGYPGKADTILFAARNHQRDSPATPGLTKVKLWVLWGLIGYGYHYYLLFLWLALLIPASYFGPKKVFEHRKRRQEEEYREREQQQVASEVHESEALMKQLFPENETFKMAGINLAHRNNQATTISGDFYNFIERSDGSLSIYFIDIQGHGLSAALQARALYQTLMDGDWGMGDARTELERADQLVEQSFVHQKDGISVTMNFTEVDPHKGVIRHANAGMPFPLLFRWGQAQPEAIRAAGLYIGGGYSRYPAAPAEAMTAAGDGDILIIMSDGIIEARDRKGRIFGQRGIVAAVSRSREETSEEIATEILRAVENHTGREKPEDDQTLVVLQIGEQLKETVLTPVQTLEGNHETFRLLNAGDTGTACHDKLRAILKAWASDQGYSERRTSQIWVATWEAIQNAAKYGSRRGDVINVGFIPIAKDRSLGVEIRQPLIWKDWNNYLGRSMKIELKSDRPFIGGSIIMLHLADEVSVRDQGRRVTMWFAPEVIPERKIVA